MQGILENDINTETYLIFSVLERRYSIPSKYIDEISLFDTVYPLPLMPPYILGIINRYSVPYALFDINLLLHENREPPVSFSQKKKALVLKDEIDRIAFLIDDVISIADITKDIVFNIEKNTESNDLSQAIVAFFKLDSNDIFVLDIQKIMDIIKKEAV